MLQLRPATVGRVAQAFYAPNRDLGQVGVAYLRTAAGLLEPETYESWFREFLQDNGVTDEQLGECASCLGMAASLITEHEDVRDALQAAGFYCLPMHAQLATYIRLGQVLLGGVWTSVRELKMAGLEPACDVQEMFDDVGRQLPSRTSRVSECGNSSEGG